MASLQEYLERRTSDELRGTLRSYSMGMADIPADTVLRICAILAKREPDLPNPYMLLRKLCSEYCKE